MPSTATNLDAAFSALADPTRRAIVARLKGRELRVSDVAAPFHMSLPAISRHVRVLEQAGLVTRTRAGREHYLRLRPEPLREVWSWVGHYERFWSERLDALADRLRTRKQSPSQES